MFLNRHQLKLPIKHLTLIATISAILLFSCVDSKATSTRVFNTPTKIFATKTPPPSPTPHPQLSVGTVLVKSLNIRSGPGTNHGVIGSMKLGEEFYILAEFNNSENRKWFLFTLPDNSFGFVIGEPSYVTDKLVTVDYTTYKTVLSSVQKAKLIYGTVPTKTSKLPLPTNSIIQQPIPTVKSQVIPSAECTCSYNAYNCSDFSFQNEAQSCFDYCQMSVGYDVHWLDEDSDGYACEWNP